MVAYTKAVSSFSVRGIADARKFYGDVLGLKVEEEYDGRVLRLYLMTGGEVLMYGKEDHEPASFTVLTFTVDDLEAAVTSLAGQGTTLERPDGLDLDQRGIHHAQGHDVAWIRDPSGNWLELNQEI